MSVKALEQWYKQNFKKLPEPDFLLISPNHYNYFSTTKEIFNKLMHTKIAERYNATSEVTVGPVGAAKILFALRPNFYAPWDRQICQNKGYNLDGIGYIKYLNDIKSILLDLQNECFQNNKQITDLINITNRTLSSLPKLIDEYNWVTITKNCIPSEIIELLER